MAKKGLVVGKRESMFEVGKVPEIDITEDVYMTKIWDYHFIYDTIVPSMRRKLCRHDSYDNIRIKNIAIAVAQTLNYLIENKLVKKPEKEPTIRFISLWKDRVELGEKFEGIRLALKNALFKYLYPEVYEKILGGAMWDSLNLTVVGEAVEYTMEYLHKQGLLVK